MIAELRRQHANLIINVHEHDSFLEENPDEELTPEERRKADEEFDLLGAAGEPLALVSRASINALLHDRNVEFCSIR